MTDHAQPLNAEFVEELRERLLMIAADERIRSAHTHLNGEIRRFSTIIEIAARLLGRPAAPSPTPTPAHASDCAIHNEPALPNGPCDCGATAQAPPSSAGEG